MGRWESSKLKDRNSLAHRLIQLLGYICGVPAGCWGYKYEKIWPCPPGSHPRNSVPAWVGAPARALVREADPEPRLEAIDVPQASPWQEMSVLQVGQMSRVKVSESLGSTWIRAISCLAVGNGEPWKVFEQRKSTLTARPFRDSAGCIKKARPELGRLGRKDM